MQLPQLKSLIVTTLVIAALTQSRSTLLTPSPAWAHDDDHEVNLAESKNQIVRLTDDGIDPPQLVMKKEDSVVFLFNASSDALATVSIDFKNRTTHCATTNLKINDDGTITSTRPMQPREFASVCFHDAGTYDVKAFGLKKNSKGVVGTIVVE